ncbi:protein IQ-DOMAIN 11 isoform X2 [Manihot esculenta]|nr:protein IQ-DOMAIN 11 isoform X2 [Manihot esculenta]
MGGPMKLKSCADNSQRKDTCILNRIWFYLFLEAHSYQQMKLIMKKMNYCINIRTYPPRSLPTPEFTIHFALCDFSFLRKKRLYSSLSFSSFTITSLGLWCEEHLVICVQVKSSSVLWNCSSQVSKTIFFLFHSLNHRISGDGNGDLMAKKRSWFNLVRKFFISDTQSNQEKDKRRKWIFFGRLKVKSRLASISAPSPPRERTTLSESEQEQSKRALNVALASAAAAEAAVAAAHAAAEVVLLTGVPHSTTHQCDKETEQVSSMKIQADTLHSTHLCVRAIQEIAALKIQAAFRGYLARKALRALKGIVKLQAIIRGRNVRRQAMNTLKCLQSIVNIQSQVCAKRIQMAEGTCACDENKQFQSDKIIRVDTNSQKRWDGSILTKEEVDTLFLSKKEAAVKRERIKEYAFNHRNSAENERNKVNGRWRYWLDQWVDSQVSNKSKELEDLDTVLTSTPKPRVEYRGKQLKLRGLQRQYQVEGLESPITAPRRSFHRKQCSLGEDNSFSRSPVIPTYMAATESAKAKARSISSPKLRPGSFDAYSDSYSPCKNKLSLIASNATEVPNNCSFGRPSPYQQQQRSPSFKGLPVPVKSSRTWKDLSLNSEYSLRTWDHQSAFH